MVFLSTGTSASLTQVVRVHDVLENDTGSDFGGAGGVQFGSNLCSGATHGQVVFERQRFDPIWTPPDTGPSVSKVSTLPE